MRPVGCRRALGAGVGFVVPLRADTGWAERFASDVGQLDRLAELDNVSQREQRLRPEQRTRWRGLLRDFPVNDPVTKNPYPLRVAYTWSSEQANSVADARERALTKAENTLARVQRGWGGPPTRSNRVRLPRSERTWVAAVLRLI